MASEVARYRFTVADYERMIESGILTEDTRVELIAGEIVEMSPMGVHHARCITRLDRFINRRVDGDLFVGVQVPIVLPDHSEPEPDLVVYREQPGAATHPHPADILLVIEVSDSTRNFDRGTKLPLYAAGIAESWLFDLVTKIIERFSEPGPQGYRIVAYARQGESLRSLTVPGLTFAVDDFIQ